MEAVTDKLSLAAGGAGPEDIFALAIAAIDTSETIWFGADTELIGIP